MIADGNSPSVLVVDENASILELIARLFDGNGLRALLARTAEEALSIASQDYVPIDLVLADVAIPDCTGPEIVSRIRASRPAVPALYMSALADAEVVRIEILHGDPEAPGETPHY